MEDKREKKFQDTPLSNENKKGFISIPIIMSWDVLFVLGGELSFGLKSKQAWFYICGPATMQASNAKPFALSNQFGPQVCPKEFRPYCPFSTQTPTNVLSESESGQKSNGPGYNEENCVVWYKQFLYVKAIKHHIASHARERRRPKRGRKKKRKQTNRGLGPSATFSAVNDIKKFPMSPGEFTPINQQMLAP